MRSASSVYCVAGLLACTSIALVRAQTCLIRQCPELEGSGYELDETLGQGSVELVWYGSLAEQLPSQLMAAFLQLLLERQRLPSGMYLSDRK